jgi:hypothetical protein
MCRSPYPAAEVRLDLALAFCPRCQTVRDLPANAGELASSGSTDVAPLPPALREKVSLPSRFSVEERPGSLVLSWKVPAAPSVGGLVFWLGLGVMAAVRGGLRIRDLSMLAVFGLITLGLAYVLVANLINVTRAEATAAGLRITHGPLPVPWRFRRMLAVAEIDQLACSSTSWRSGTYYDLCVLRRDGSTTTLVSGFSEPQQALYLEQQFERRLKIVDRPVPGEL